MRQLKIKKGITNRDSLSVEKYLQDIGKEKLISVEEEVILTQKIRQGDLLALEKLCKANLRFVVSVAKQYQNRGLSLPDLINEGNIGLIQAAKKFDETRGFKFISYAVWWIRQSILQGIANKSRLVRLPISQIGLIKNIQRAQKTLEQKLKRSPSNEELSEFMEIPYEKILNASCFPTVLIDKKEDEEDGNYSFFDLISNDDPPTDFLLTRKSDEEYLAKMLQVLSEEERSIIKIFYGIGQNAMTQNQIAQQRKISKEKVRLIIKKAILKIRIKNKITR